MMSRNALASGLSKSEPDASAFRLIKAHTIERSPSLTLRVTPHMSLRILLIEDEDEIAAFVSRGLREEGHSVEWVAHGSDARREMQREWDLIVLDWSLPGVEGITLLRQFRTQGRDTPVLMLTARDAVSDRVTGLDAGADDYLCKPFAFAELLARVRALARRPAATVGTKLQQGDITADLLTYRYERAGRLLDLTSKEQALLLMFLRHPEQVLSRTRIYEQVWNDQYDGLSNTLEVHVKELRRKLEQHGDRVIHTVRGSGYVFSTDPESRWAS